MPIHHIENYVASINVLVEVPGLDDTEREDLAEVAKTWENVSNFSAKAIAAAEVCHIVVLTVNALTLKRTLWLSG